MTNLMTKKNFMMLMGIVCGISMVFLDSSILPVALPTIKEVFGASSVTLRWIVNIFFLIESMFVILGGRLGDIFGVKRVYTYGLVVFALSSFIGGFAVNTTMLLIARGLQGFGAALVAPSMVALVVSSFPISQRGKFMGIAVSMGTIFLSLGPFIGGIFTQYLSWRWVFFVNIFIAAAGVFFTTRYIPQTEGKAATIDHKGAVLFGSTLLLFTLGIMGIEKVGLLSTQTLGYFGVGSLLAFLFYLYNKRSVKDPLIDFSLFKNIQFTVANIHGFLSQMLLTNGVFWALFLQKGLMLSPALAGMVSLVTTLPMLVTAPLGGHLSDLKGGRYPMTLGFGCLITTFALIVLFYQTSYFPILFAAMFIFGGSITLIMTPLSTSVVASAGVEKRGIASGIFYTTRFTGATVGVAVIGMIYSSLEKISHHAALLGISVFSLMISLLALALLYHEKFLRRTRQASL